MALSEQVSRLLVCGVLVAATAGPVGATSTRTAYIEPGGWESAVRERGVDPGLFESPLAVSDEMREAARRYSGAGDDLVRLGRLQRSLFDPDNYTFEYHSDRTLSAREAFEAERGNCVSFVNLFIALARTQDIRVRPAILRHVRDVALEGDLLVVNTHLVAAYEGPKRAEIFDFYRSRSDVAVAVRLLDDLDLNAIYVNNLGVERLREDDFERAVEYFEAAVALSPGFAEAYANLGVARRRMGDEQGALDAYFGGLAMDPGNVRLLNNLTTLYRRRAGEHGADPDSRPAGDDPVTALEIVARADADLARGHLDRALDLYKRAHRMDSSRVEPVVGIARMQIVSGKLNSARKTLLRAREIDPEDSEVAQLLRYLDRKQ